MHEPLIACTIVPLILRLGLAVIFVMHGQDKIFTEGNELGANWDKRTEALPKPAQVAAAWGELVGGAALALGFLTRFAALGIAAIMAGAIWTVTGKNGFFLRNHGYEYNLAILAMCAAVLLLGGGNLAFDRWFRFRRSHPPDYPT